MDAEQAKVELQKVQIEEAIKSPMVLMLESITQEEAQQKLWQENDNEVSQLFQTSPVLEYPIYPWKMIWGFCIGSFIGTIGCVGVLVYRVEKKGSISG